MIDNNRKKDLIIFGVSGLLLLYSVFRLPELFEDNRLSIFFIVVIIGLLVSYMSNRMGKSKWTIKVCKFIKKYLSKIMKQKRV